MIRLLIVLAVVVVGFGGTIGVATLVAHQGRATRARQLEAAPLRLHELYIETLDKAAKAYRDGHPGLGEEYTEEAGRLKAELDKRAQG